MEVKSVYSVSWFLIVSTMVLKSITASGFMYAEENIYGIWVKKKKVANGITFSIHISIAQD